MAPSKNVSVVLPKGLLEEIDDKRGHEPRSKYIRRQLADVHDYDLED